MTPAAPVPAAPVLEDGGQAYFTPQSTIDYTAKAANLFDEWLVAPAPPSASR